MFCILAAIHKELNTFCSPLFINHWIFHSAPSDTNFSILKMLFISQLTTHTNRSILLAGLLRVLLCRHRHSPVGSRNFCLLHQNLYLVDLIFRSLFLDDFPVHRIVAASDTEVLVSSALWLDFLFPNSDKGTGLRALADHFGFRREEILSFGDNFNDIEIFREIGVSVAVDNARSGIAELCDYTTPSVVGFIEDFCF